MILNGRPELKKELIQLRQSSNGRLRNLTRRTIRYIEQLEKRLEDKVDRRPGR